LSRKIKYFKDFQQSCCSVAVFPLIGYCSKNHLWKFDEKKLIVALLHDGFKKAKGKSVRQNTMYC